MSDEANLLFVYGLLRKGSSHPMAQYLAAHAEYVAKGSIYGSLYLISDYPGVIVRADGGRIIGDIYSINEEALWEKMDAFEEVPFSDEYRKEWIEVLTEDGQKKCTTYVYNRPVDGLRQIASGDFLRFAGGDSGISPS